MALHMARRLPDCGRLGFELEHAGVLHRRFGESMALNLGYRYLTNDFEESDGSYGWDVNQCGPVLGYAWAF